MTRAAVAMSPLSKYAASVWLALGLSAALIVCFVVYVRAEKRIDHANEARQRSFLLAEELRQSSDDLTRVVRTYVVTGDPLYRRQYQDILDIRDGRKAHPRAYHGGYWYLQADEGHVGETVAAVAILDAMRQAGFTAEEFGKLAQAKARSDALTRTEFSAMALAEASPPGGGLDAARAQAVRMLHDGDYQLAKADIMRPIFELYEMVDARTLKAVEAAASEADDARLALIAISALLLVTILSMLRSLTAVLGGSLHDVFESMSRLGSGDFSQEATLPPGREGSVLAGLRRARASLAELDAQRRRNEQATRESERRFNDALDSMLEGCMLIASDWTYLYVNEVAARHAHRARDAMVGRKITDVHPEIENTRLLECFRRVMQGRTAERFQDTFTYPDGSVACFELSIVPTPQGIFVLSLDITEQRQLAQRLEATNLNLERQVAERTAELQRALDAAKEASREKSMFLSSMSHELRTPMNAILGFSQLLLMRDIPAQQKAQVEEIRRAGEHLLALIDDLLDLTRIEAGQTTVAREPVDLCVVVADALSIVSPLLSQHKLQVTQALPSEAWVTADAVRLRQVVVNLLSNAAKYNREGGRVAIEVSRSAGQRLRLLVRDTGLGIAPEETGRLFRTFERLGAQQRGIEGTGIGLALSRRLVELMGGSIGVESSVGEGSAFWIELAPSSPAGPAADAVLPSPAQAAAASFRVLYIEDNPTNVMVVEHLFRERRGWQLLTASTGAAGLELARQRRPDAILLDIHLPEADGYEVLAQLRADPRTRTIPVIALSADAMPAQVQRGLQAGLLDYLPKPLDLRRLIALLDGLASRLQRADERPARA